jgi:hypothetical protein
MVNVNEYFNAPLSDITDTYDMSKYKIILMEIIMVKTRRQINQMI